MTTYHLDHIRASGHGDQRKRGYKSTTHHFIQRVQVIGTDSLLKRIPYSWAGCREINIFKQPLNGANTMQLLYRDIHRQRSSKGFPCLNRNGGFEHSPSIGRLLPGIPEVNWTCVPDNTHYGMKSGAVCRILGELSQGKKTARRPSGLRAFDLLQCQHFLQLSQLPL